jgi:hypothetical protein
VVSWLLSWPLPAPAVACTRSGSRSHCSRRCRLPDETSVHPLRTLTLGWSGVMWWPAWDRAWGLVHPHPPKLKLLANCLGWCRWHALHARPAANRDHIDHTPTPRPRHPHTAAAGIH